MTSDNKIKEFSKAQGLQGVKFFLSNVIETTLVNFITLYPLTFLFLCIFRWVLTSLSSVKGKVQTFLIHNVSMEIKADNLGREHRHRQEKVHLNDGLFWRNSNLVCLRCLFWQVHQNISLIEISILISTVLHRTGFFFFPFFLHVGKH